MSSTRHRITGDKENDNLNNNQSKIIVSPEIKELHDIEITNCKPFFDVFIENSYYFVQRCRNYIYITITFVLQVSGIYILWIILHFIASHLYTRFCVPNSVVGFFMSPFLTATPHCQGLRWIIYNAANVINNMWLVLGAWICSTLLVINRDSSNDN